MNDALSLSPTLSEAPVLAPTAPLLQVSVIGGASFAYGGGEIRLRNRKARAMLAYLALSDSGEEQRERLAGMFWSETSEHNARTTLRQVLHEVREAMLAAGCDALNATRLTVGLQPGSFAVDLDTTLVALAAREAPDVMLRQARMAETLLQGLDDLDPAFHGWLTARRQTLHDRLVRGLEEGYRDATLPRRQRRRLAEAALLLDPTHEEACRMVMRCAAEDGELPAALRAYEQLYRLLDADYDSEPSAATLELVAEVKQGKFDHAARDGAPVLSYETEMRQVLLPQHRAAAPSERPAIPCKPALFVDEFAMSGVGADQAHLVQGFRFELIACLARFREWYVSGTESDPAEEPAGVPVSTRYAVTTTAYQGGASINVVMVLQERPSGLAVWGERFELRLDRWFEAQHQIVRRIAATLNVQLTTERLVRHSHVPEGSLEAYDVWLRGQLVINGYRAGDWNRTAQMLARAIEQSPGFSPLYSSLSQMNNVVHFVQPGMFRDAQNTQRTLSLAQKAVALDPRDSRAELCLGWALAFCQRYTQAELHMEIACELNSNDSWTLMSTAMFHAFNGDTERALKQAALSLEMTLSPTLSHWAFLTSIRYLHGDYAGTIVAADRAQDGLLTVPAWRAAALCKLGRQREATQDVARFYANARAAWASDAPATEETIGQWLMHLYPINGAEMWQRLYDGIALTGIPISGVTRHG